MKNLRFYLNKALKENFALGAINFNNMETLQGIIEACKNAKSPAIISVSEGALEYMGENFVKSLGETAKDEFAPLFLHLDHGKSVEICKKAIDLGFDSVMIDGSSLDFEENVKITNEVCNFAHKKNVLVEGELGVLKGIEDNVSAENHVYTNPQKAKEFVDKTKVDMLAIAIGTSHGAYKYKGEQTLRFDILSEIEKLLPNFPLVLHGASTVNQELIDIINNFGGEIKDAKGIPVALLQEAVKKHNIVKINTDTDIRLSLTCQVRKVLTEKKSEFDPRKYLGKGREKITETVTEKINNIFFSNNKI